MEKQDDEIPAWMKPHPQCDHACLYICTEGFRRFPTCADPAAVECEHGMAKSSCGFCHDEAAARQSL